MKRRDFLRTSASALLGAAGCRGTRSTWDGLRLVRRPDASPIEIEALEDAASLLTEATARAVPVMESGGGTLDVFVEVSPGAPAGAFRVSSTPEAIVVEGADPEGARNGLYALLEAWGFGFFRDGATVPSLRGAMGRARSLTLHDTPAFRWRGDMIWDNYLGPRRYCASMWGEAEWERALLHMARHRMNFLEFYPPLEIVYARAFPEVAGQLEDGAVWKSDVKHALAQRVLARGRALGIHFMYVLSYGAFPAPVRALFENLEWRNGFLCAHQPELMELTERVWRSLVEELGTDHWYAIRHRGEEEQVYSDPCRSVTKAQGFQQAFDVMRRVDPAAKLTVWTWGERLPDLFQGFPENVRAAHIRHGMADVFGDLGEGREQADGRPDLPATTPWLSGQFTVFGANEAGLQTAWCDAVSLASDARASREHGAEGYFQWPEWSDTSPWLSHVVAHLGWRPEVPELERYAMRRHGSGSRAEAFLLAFGPLVRDGNARFMSTPRKRLLVPYFNAPDSLALLAAVREGARGMLALREGASEMFLRDFMDIVSWVGSRQAQVLECEAYLRYLEGREASFAAAEATWETLARALHQRPELSIVASASELESVGALSSRLEDSLWTLACDFYNGYPLVLCPEAVELVYLPQLRRLRDDAKGDRPVVLEPPGWFWHDFPDRAWAECVRKLPGEDAGAFEREMRARLRAEDRAAELRDEPDFEALLSTALPAPRPDPPSLPTALADRP